jgi:hypothetical protein
MSSWTYAIYDTMSGVLQSPIQLVSNSMGRTLNAGNSGSSTLFSQPNVSSAQLRDLTTPWARTLVKSRDGIPVAAHMITGREWDHDTTLLTIDHADVWTILSRRTTFGSNGYSGADPVNNNLPLVGFTLESMTWYLIWAGTDGPTVNFGLPIYLPSGKLTYALISGLPHSSSNSRTYWDYDVTFLDHGLSELMAVGGGPDLDFQPRFNTTTGNLELLMKVGSIAGGSSDWNMTATQRPLFGLKHKEDALNQANVVYAIGKGSEADMRVATASGAPSIPALEKAVNYKQLDDLTVLQSHANADLALYNRPTSQWSASMLADAGPGIAAMAPAHALRLYFKDHLWEPDGWVSLRLVGFTTDMSETVSLTVQAG